jgi:hypothetical protein
MISRDHFKIEIFDLDRVIGFKTSLSGEYAGMMSKITLAARQETW